MALARVPPSRGALPLGDERDRALPGQADQPIPIPDLALEEGDLSSLERADIVMQDDGSAMVMPAVAEQAEGAQEFLVNLAEVLTESELSQIGLDLSEKIKRDKESRDGRDKQYAEGIKRTGMGNEAPGGAQFTGASRAVHPMLTEACIDFESAAIKELFPAEGPVKPQILGPSDQNKIDLAERQQRCLNWQLTRWVPEYIPVLERILTQVPMGGSQFQKFWVEPRLGRWTCEAIYIDDLYIPYSATDFWNSPRLTHVQRLTESQVEDRVGSGMYRDIGGLGDVSHLEQTEAEKATDKVQGRSRIEPNIDNERPVFECSIEYELPDRIDKGKRLPYLISLDDYTGRIFSIYRNWEEDDVRHLKLHWIVDWNFIPWRGAYAIGFPQLIGGLSSAATGALRALLDSAHVNNIPGGLILKGWGISGQTSQAQATQFVEVQGSSQITDDIRKIAMAFPYNPPSTALMQLLEWLTAAAKGVVTTAEEKIAEASNQMPVGTALALIESGSKVFSAIHARLHRSHMRALEVIARLCTTIEGFEQAQLTELGEVLASPRDFSRALAVQPASDPAVFSEGQRIARAQILEMQAAKYPQAYNLYAVQRRVLVAARIPDIDEVLPPPPQPQPLNAAAENVAAITGKPLLAFPEQAHLAHIMTHLLFLSDPILGPKGISGTPLVLNMAEHLKQHVSMQYAVLVRMIASEAAGKPIDQFMKQAEDDPRLAARVDQVIAAAAPQAQRLLAQQLAPVAQTLSQLFQTARSMQASNMQPNADAVAAASLVDEAARKASESAGNLALKKHAQGVDEKEAAAKITLDNRKQTLAEQKFEFEKQAEAERLANEHLRDQLMLKEAQTPGNAIPGV